MKHQIELLQYLSVWVKEKNRIIVGVLHDLNLVHRFSDYTALMRDGEIVSRGKPEEVLNGAVLREVYGMDIGAFMRESLERWGKM
ncbi:hypothetical protein AGMMS49579_20620 [Spirochaetia bacterium]|nr:hypothetical protein AGMMS49579_20620 [Spirochaetia bacterium]